MNISFTGRPTLLCIMGLILLGMVLSLGATLIRSRHLLSQYSANHQHILSSNEISFWSYLRLPGEDSLTILHGESWLVRSERVLQSLPDVHIIATRLHYDHGHPYGPRTHAIIVRDGKPISALLTWADAAELLTAHEVRFRGDDGPASAAEIMADIFRIELVETGIDRKEGIAEVRARYYIPPFIHETVLFVIDEDGVLSYERVISTHQRGSFL